MKRFRIGNSPALWARDGTMMVYETDATSPGSGLQADGTLGPGMTYTVELHKILEEITSTIGTSFNGFGWFVLNADGVEGTYTVISVDALFSQSQKMDPTIGSGGTVFGFPVFIP